MTVWIQYPNPKLRNSSPKPKSRTKTRLVGTLYCSPYSRVRCLSPSIQTFSLERKYCILEFEWVRSLGTCSSYKRPSPLRTSHLLSPSLFSGGRRWVRIRALLGRNTVRSCSHLEALWRQVVQPTNSLARTKAKPRRRAVPKE